MEKTAGDYQLSITSMPNAPNYPQPNTIYYPQPATAVPSVISEPECKPIEYHKWLKDDTIKIKLMKMSKGMQWELSCEGENTDLVIARLQEADDKLRAIYGTKEE